MEFSLIILIINYVLVLSYLGGLLAYGFIFFKRDSENREKLNGRAGRLLGWILLFHLLYLTLRSIYYQHAPITNLFELATLTAFGVTLTYKFIEYKTKVYDTGFFILAAAAVFQIISTLFIRENSEVNPVLKSWLLGVHVSAALVGYSAIIISGIYGFLYLMLYRQLKLSRVSNFYKKLPSLHLLEQLADNSIMFGFFFLTITIVIGIIWLPGAIKDFSITDPKLVSTSIIWVLYAVGFMSTRILKTRSKTTMTLALFGFLFTFFSILVLNLFMESFHRFL